ncbi:MAG TPA: cytochrome c [Stellaceae bacterium]|nr:cytochrome c [Stellaceae bacterium]
MASAPRPAFSPAQAEELEQPGDPAKGQTVFDAAGCASCHASPGQDDRRRLGGGLALASPFGIFRVPNISPDPNDGIGRWRTIDLANALISGVSPKDQHYYPALPYVDYTHMRMEDLRDLMAYLKTLPPVEGKPPPHELYFPFNIRRLVGLWKLLYLDTAPIRDDPGQTPAWNRGRYLVEALGHCDECHSSRNLAGAIKENTRFAGGPDPEGVGYVPNITPGGIGDWSQDDIVRALTDGRTPQGHVLGSTMADIVTNMAALPAEDRNAVATFIKSLPKRSTPPP